VFASAPSDDRFTEQEVKRLASSAPRDYEWRQAEAGSKGPAGGGADIREPLAHVSRDLRRADGLSTPGAHLQNLQRKSSTGSPFPGLAFRAPAASLVASCSCQEALKWSASDRAQR
jgi:hypothetical protein